MSDYERLEELRDAAERALDAYFDYAQAMVDVADKHREEVVDENERLKNEISRMRKVAAQPAA